MAVGHVFCLQPALQLLAIPLVSLQVAPWLEPKSTTRLPPRNFGDTTLGTVTACVIAVQWQRAVPEMPARRGQT